MTPQEAERIGLLLALATLRAVYGSAPSTSTPTPTDAGTPRPEKTTEARQEIDQ